jgi:murein DD-endopeptidase MepM/ murein hydrolase activator NlpD
VKRKSLLFLVLLMITALIVKPYDGQALTEIQKIDQDLKKLKEEMDRAAHNQKNAEQSVKVLTGQKDATKEDIQALLGRIDQVQKKLETTQSKIADAEDKLFVTGQELEDAIKQLNNRKQLMDSRVRLAYTTGAASYLDVLLSSTSFSDFLERFDAVESILTQDRNIADQKQAYSEEVTKKKPEVEQELKDVKMLYDEMATHKAELEQNEQDKEVMMSKLTKQIDDMEEISEESEKQLTEIAKRASALEAKKNRIKNYYKGGKLGMPLRSEWHESSSFGYRIHPVTGKKKLHTGIDMAAPKGTPIYAAETGIVTVAQSYSGYGNCIIIDHGGDLLTVYGHLMVGGILVQKGETVKRGEKIGLVGSTGISTGNHLHFEVRKNFEPVNPAPYLNLK